MQTPTANSGSKTFIIVAVILVVLAGGYYFYQSGSKTTADATSGVGDSNSLDTTSAAGTDENGIVVGADVYSLLGQIQSLKIDPTFFAKTVYQSLVDYTVEIPPEPVGRPNPFAPISGSSGSQSSSAAAAARALQK